MNKIFLDLDGTLAKFDVERALERFDKEKGFFSQLEAFNNIEIVNELAKKGNLFIISASPNEQADKDKMFWIKKYLPNISLENITLCRIGENKANIIESKYNIKINENCYLLDDYSKNLFEWLKKGGTGIKRITPISDNSRKLWKGAELVDLQELAQFV